MKGVTPILVARAAAEDDRAATARSRARAAATRPCYEAVAGRQAAARWPGRTSVPTAAAASASPATTSTTTSSNDSFRTLLLNAVAWVTKLEVPSAGVPSRTPTDEELDEARRRGAALAEVVGPASRAGPAAPRSHLARVFHLVLTLNPGRPVSRSARGTYSTGPKSWFAGPLMTLPSLAKREPWHGQSHVFSASFHCTMQPRCGQTAEQLVQLALVVAVDGDLGHAAAQHRAAARLISSTESTSPRRHPVQVLRGDVDVLLDEGAGRAQRSCARGRRASPRGSRGRGSGRSAACRRSCRASCPCRSRRWR